MAVVPAVVRDEKDIVAPCAPDVKEAAPIALSNVMYDTQ